MKFDKNSRSIVAVLAIMMFVGSSIGTALLTQGGANVVTVIEAGSMISEASYIIAVDDNGMTFAKNCTSGRIDFKSANETEVIQETLSIGGIIAVKNGEYEINPTLRMKAGSQILGENRQLTRFMTPAGVDAITVNAAGNNTWLGGAIKDIHIEGGTPSDPSLATGISVDNVSFFNIIDVEIVRYSKQVVLQNWSFFAVIEHCQFELGRGIGIYLTGTNDHRPNDALIRDNNIALYDVDYPCFGIYSDPTCPAGGVKIQSNWIEASGLQPSKWIYGKLHGAVIDSNVIATGTAGGVGIELTEGAVGVQITNNLFAETGSGIILAANSSGSIGHNSFEGIDTDAITANGTDGCIWTISDNRFELIYHKGVNGTAATNGGNFIDVHNNYFTRVYNESVYMCRQVQGNNFVRNVGIGVKNCLSITGNSFQYNGEEAIYSSMSKAIISNNIIDDNCANNHIHYGMVVIGDNSSVTNNRFLAVNAGHQTIGLQLYCDGGIVMGNIFNGQQNTAIQDDGVNNTKVYNMGA